MPATGGGAWRGAAARTATPARVPSSGLAGRIGFPDWCRWLEACVAQEVEQRRLFAWIAVSFGVGVLLFFAAEGRPRLWAPLAGAALAAGAAYALRSRPVGLGASRRGRHLLRICRRRAAGKGSEFAGAVA